MVNVAGPLTGLAAGVPSGGNAMSNGSSALRTSCCASLSRLFASVFSAARVSPIPPAELSHAREAIAPSHCALTR